MTRGPRLVAWLAPAVAVSLVLAGCAPQGPGETATPTPSAPVQVDAGAIAALIDALQALEPYAGSPDAAPASDDTCAWLGTVADMLAQGVPLDEYRDLYEDITRDTAYVARNCQRGELDEIGVAAAVSARAGVVTILNDREVMGNDTWH